MNDENRIDPGHNRPRNALRKAGPIVLGAGIVLTVVGFGSLFVAIATGGTPILFFLAFIGLPLTFVGTVMTFAGYMGKIARYTQAESAPVAKDTFNYLADGTQEGVRTVATAIGEGIGAGIGAGAAGTEGETKIRCHKCNDVQAADAKFCDNCGATMEKNKSCPKCSELNDPDARFCDNCGHSF